MGPIERRRTKVVIENEALAMYYDTLRAKGTEPLPHRRVRRNAVAVEAKAVAALSSEPWLYFQSQSLAKKHCLKCTRMNTGITQCVRGKLASCKGWKFRLAI